MALLPNQSVVVSQKQAQLGNSSSAITAGEFISSTGDKALVLLEGEDIPREVSLANVASSESIIGNISSRRGESAIIDLSPRRSY